MKKRVKAVSVGALLTALTLMVMYIAFLIPTGNVGVVAVCALLTAAAVIECGTLAGALVFASSSILSLLLFPGVSILYVLFFGYYPILKSFFERLKRVSVEWVMKLLTFNAVLTAWMFIFKSAFSSYLSFLDAPVVVLYIVFNGVFVLFDIGLSKLIGFYMIRISKNIKH